MKNDYNSGKKQYSRDNGGSNNNFNRGGDFKRGGGKSYGSDRPYSSDKPKKFGNFNKSDNFKKFDRNDRNDRAERPDRADKPYRSNNFGGKPNYSSNNRNDNFKKFERKPFGDKPQFEKKFDNNDRPFKKFDRFDNKDKKFDRKPFGDKPKFERKFDKPDRKFDNNDRKFEKPERKFERKFDNKFEKKTAGDIPEVIVANVEQEDSGMVYGRNAVIELLKSGKSIDKLFVQTGQREGSITMIFAEAVKKAIPIIEVEKVKLDSMINNSAHQGVIALASEKEYCSVDDILQIAEERNEKPFILIADRIMDPHNLGALIRTAECAGVHGIIIPKRHAAGVSPIVTKTSAGASIYIAIAKVANIANTIEELKEKGVWAFASALDLDSNSSDIKEIKEYTNADYDIPLALVVGNEGEGLSPIVIQKSDFLIKIPMLGKIESLNVSCASAVLMYEISRQRKQK